GAVGDRAAALGLDRVDHLLRHRLVGARAVARSAEIVDNDRRAFAREQSCVGLTEAAARARDDGHLLVEQSHDVFSLQSCVYLPSWPALCRPSTSLFPQSEDVDARDKPGHDESYLADRRIPITPAPYGRS